MTISTTSNNITYAIDGSTTEFAFTFTVYQSADVTCYLVDSSGTETAYTDFSVVLNDNNAGGTVTTNTTLTTDDGASILIIRETEQTQELDLIEGGKFPSDSVEDSFDKLTMLAQDRQTELSNALKKATSNSQTIGVSVLTDDKVVGYDGENIVSGPVDLDQVDSISARNTAISNAVAGLSGDVTVLKAVATANNTTLDDVAYLATGATLAGEHYFYYVADEITYVSDTALTGSLTDIGTDSNGIRTLTIGGSSYSVYATDMVLPSLVKPIGTTQDYINSAASAAIVFDRPLYLIGNTYTLTGPIDLTGVKIICCDYTSALNVTVDSDYATNFPDGYAVFIGNTVGDADTGRSTASYISGMLRVVSSSRSYPLHGVYLKGSWLGIDTIRATGFKGHGIHNEAVWDSYVNKLSTEYCGNPDASGINDGAAIYFGGDDTVNTTHYISIQCESSYQYAISGAGHVRCQIDNIHSEETYVSDGTLASYRFTGSNNQYGQAYFDNSGASTDPEGNTLDTSNNMYLAFNEENTSVGRWYHNGDWYRTYGDRCVVESLTCLNYTESDAGTGLTINYLNCSGTFAGYNESIVKSGIIGIVSNSYNANLNTFKNCTITTVSYGSTLAGGFRFNDCMITTVGECKNGTESYSGGRYTIFNNCTITTFNGAYNSTVQVYGGYVSDAELVSQAVAEFYNVKFGTFNYSGNACFTTLGCTASTITAWTAPANTASTKTFRAGERTQRVGYSASANMYLNTADGLNFTAVY